MATLSDFIKGTDCGYSDKTLLCHKGGTSEHSTSVYKSGSRWVLARISNGACWSSKEFKTRREAIENA